MVFSSKTAVYGFSEFLPVSEGHVLAANNPYGQSKLIVEKILNDTFNAQRDWHIGLLRYFNPVGAHKSVLIGEDPQGIPNNLMPILAQVAIGRLKILMCGV